MTAEALPVFATSTWLIVALTVVLLILGAAWYGWSTEVHHRFWQDIFDRAHGPMIFRYYLRPMAALAALADGIKDGKLGRESFFWTALGTRRSNAAACGKVWPPQPASRCLALAWT